MKHNTARALCSALLGLLLACAIPLVAASDKTSPRPASNQHHGALTAQQQAAIRDYDRWVSALARSGKVSGMATAIVIGNQVRYEKGMGLADASTGEPITPTTVFRIASLSKGFSSALAALLVRDGRFTWDTRIADVLTYFKLRSDAATERMTLRDILSHRTGLPHNTFDHKLEGDVSYRELVRELDQVPLTCTVGECYGYQNVAFSMLGDLVYAVTGDFFNHQVEKRLFQPLGMTTATYGRAALEDSTSWARPHIREHGNFIPLVPKPNYYWVSPAAGVNASLRDMEKWLAAQMGDRPDVLPGVLLDVLHAPVVETRDQLQFSPWRRTRLRRADYALGWRVLDYAGHTMVFHAGAVEGYRAMIGFLPESEIGIVLLWNCNCSAPAGLLPMFFDRVLGLPPVDWAGLDNATRRHGSPQR